MAGRRAVAVHRATGARGRRQRDGGRPVLALQHLGEPLSLAGLSARSAVSVRSFTRRFRQETGLSPARWLAQQRVALARQLLESTDTPVERVATDAGFGTTASRRQHLHAAIGIAPLAYRRTFRGSPDVTSDSPVRAR